MALPSFAFAWELLTSHPSSLRRGRRARGLSSETLTPTPAIPRAPRHHLATLARFLASAFSANRSSSKTVSSMAHSSAPSAATKT